MNRVVLFLTAALALLTGSAPAQTLTPIRVLVSPLEANGPLFYAQDLGLFKKAGLDVQIQTTFAGVQTIATAVLSGTADIGSASTATLAQAHLRGLDLRFFAPGAIFTESARPTEVIAVLKSSPIRSAADLNGKTVSSGLLGSMLQCATIAWVDKHGGNGQSLKFVEITFPQMDAALQQHRVDAVVLTEPYTSAASSDTRVIGHPEDGVAPTFMTQGWYSTSAWLDAHPDVAARLIATIREAAAWGNAHPKESAAISSKYSKIPLDVVDKMARSVNGLELDPKLIQAPIDVAAHYGFIEHSFLANDIVWIPPAKK